LKIGIWGFGLVGKSILQSDAVRQKFISESGDINLEIFDSRNITDDEKYLISMQFNLVDAAQVKIKFTHYSDTDSIYKFLSYQDIIIPSPGIDLEPYKNFLHKFKSELSLFAHLWLDHSIAVTGTLGKTSLVNLIDLVLNNLGRRTLAIGNIGRPLLTAIGEKNLDYPVLELSSFQLDLKHNYKPNIAIWTNYYLNHLDRHKTAQEYFRSKASLFKYQDNQDFSILPLSIASKIRLYLNDPKRPLKFFSVQTLEFNTIEKLYKDKILSNLDVIYMRKVLGKSEKIYKYSLINGRMVYKRLNNLDILTKIFSNSFTDNLLILAVLLDLLSLDAEDIKISNLETLKLPHRLEFIGTYKESYFYNDSKSTVIEATLKSVELLSSTNNKNILLFLGGTSKGVDRIKNIEIFKKFQLKKVLCFGKEALELEQACSKYGFNASAYSNLDLAFKASINILEPNDIVLFSPGGASFDLFSNYIERGDYFKSLVKQLVSQKDL
jgi:UDP-N-acetylmuramoylalanine--D-glutamate ligase